VPHFSISGFLPKAATHCCDDTIIQLYYPREQADETGAVVSDYRFGIVADGLGGEIISHRASAEVDN
jgi:hypothetical protein